MTGGNNSENSMPIEERKMVRKKKRKRRKKKEKKKKGKMVSISPSCVNFPVCLCGHQPNSCGLLSFLTTSGKGQGTRVVHLQKSLSVVANTTVASCSVVRLVSSPQR